MANGADDSVVKIMSYLGLDYSNAYEATKAFEVNFQAELKKIENIAQTSVSKINQQFGNIGKALSESTASATDTARNTTEKTTRALSTQLARIEKQLLNAERIYQKIGVSSPEISPALREVRGYRDVLESGGKLDKNAKKAISNAQKLASIQQNTAQSLAKQVELYTNRNNLEKVGADSRSKNLIAEARARENINRKWDAEIEKQRLLAEKEKKAQMEAMWRERERIKLEQRKAAQSRTNAEIKQYEARIIAEQNAKVALPSMKLKTAEVQRRIAAQGLSKEYMTQAQLLRQQIVSVMRRAQTEKGLTGEEIKQTNELRRQLRLLEQQVKTATADKARMAKAKQGSSYNVLGSQWERRASWFLAGSAFFGLIAGAREAVSTMKEVEMGMIEIARITDDVTFNFDEMRDELLDLGVQYGQTFERVQDIAVKWSQAGYNVADTLELTRSSLLALNTAELNAEQATQGLIAIMAQWGLTAEDLLPTIDKINKTADSFAITSQDLVDGLNRSGAAARNMGMSLKETIGLITVMREASGRAGKEVGNALNTILSYVQRTKSINVMEQLGIDVFTDEARTQFRSIMDIFSDLAERWSDPDVSNAYKEAFVESAEAAGLMNEELAVALGLQEEYNDMQKRDLSQGLAGVRRRNYLISLMQRFSKTQEVVNNMHEAEGYSMRENQRTMETLEKRYKALITSAEKLAVSLGDAGLLDALKTITDAGTAVTETFDSLDDTMKSLIINTGLAFGALKLFKGIAGMIGVGGAGAAAGTAAAGGTLAGIGPWGWAAIGATSIGLAIYNNVSKANEAYEEQATVIGDLGKKYFDLKDKINSLDESTNEYKNTQDSLHEVMQSISDINPTLIKDWNDAAEITKINEGAVRKYIETYEELKGVTDTEDEGVKGIISGMESKVEDIQSTIDNLSDLKGQYDALQEASEDEIKASAKREKIEEIEGRVIEIVGERQKIEKIASKNIGEYIDGIITKKGELIDAERENAINSIDIKKAETESKIALIDEELETLRELREEKKEEEKEHEDETWLQSIWRGFTNPVRDYIDKIIEYGGFSEEDQGVLREGLGVSDVFGETVEGLSSDIEEFIKQKQELINAKEAYDKAKDDLLKPPETETETKAAVFDRLQNARDLLEAQKRLNDEIKNQIGLSDARIQLYSRENASIDEQIAGIKESIRQHNMTMQYQSGLNAEIAKTESLIKRLREEQAQYEGIEEEESIEEYEKLDSEIASLTNRVGELKIQSAQLNTELMSGINTRQLERSIRENNIELMKQKVDFLTREGASVKELSQAEDIRLSLINQYRERENDLNTIIDEQNRLQDEAVKLYSDHADQQDKLNKIKQTSNQIIAESKQELLEIMAIIEEMNTSELSTMDYKMGVTENTISLLKTRIDYMTREGATVRDLNRADDIRLSLVNEYKDLIDDLNSKIEEQYKKQREAKEELGENAEKQGLLNRILAESDDKITDYKEKVIEYTEAIGVLNDETYFLSSAYERATKSLDHWTNMGVLSTEQQIEATRKLTEYKDLSTDEQWKIDERLFDLYREGLMEQQQDIEKAYKKRIELIEKEADAAIKANQEKIDQLNKEKEIKDREEAEREHNKRIADLLEERQYHEVRTGEEHRKKIEEIDKKIEEEKTEWKNKQEEYRIEDKIKALEDENEEIKKGADKDKKALEEAYEQMKEDFKAYNLDMIALAATYDEDYYDDGLTKGEQWLKGFEEGIIGEDEDGGPGKIVSDLIKNIKSDTNIPQPISGGIRAAANEIVWLKGQWTEAAEEKNVEAMNKYDETAKSYYEKLESTKRGREIAEHLHRMNYEQAFRYYENLPKFHSGGKTLSAGMAVVEPGEIYFPSNLSAKMDSLLSLLKNMPIQQMQTIDKGRVINFYAPLFNSEETNLNDDVDEKSFSRELTRAVQTLSK